MAVHVAGEETFSQGLPGLRTAGTLHKLNETIDHNPDGQFDQLKLAAVLAGLPLGMAEHATSVTDIRSAMSKCAVFKAKVIIWLHCLLEIVDAKPELLAKLDSSEEDLVECRKSLRFATLIVRICQGLDSKQFASLQGLAHPLLEPLNTVNIATKVELFRSLYERQHIKENNLSRLEDLMEAIGRQDLIATFIEPYKKIQNPVTEASGEPAAGMMEADSAQRQPVPDALHPPQPAERLDVIAADTLVYSGEARRYVFHGLELDIPENALPKDILQIKIDLLVGTSGQFTFPEDTKLVSGIYNISPSHNFSKPVTVFIQHCAPVKSDKLVFASAKGSQFVKMAGGSFNIPEMTHYGRISCDGFSSLSVLFEGVSQLLWPRFHAVVIYEDLRAHFTVTRQLDADVQAVRNQLGVNHGPQYIKSIAFNGSGPESNVRLKFPDRTNIIEDKGWKIHVHGSADPVIKIKRSEIPDSDRRCYPVIELRMQWDGEPPEMWKYLCIPLEGTTDPDNDTLDIACGEKHAIRGGKMVRDLKRSQGNEDLFTVNLWDMEAAADLPASDRPAVIAILDSGINRDHEAFNSKQVVISEDFTCQNDTKDYSVDGHGTMCAGVAAGNMYRKKVSTSIVQRLFPSNRKLIHFPGGVAPRAKIVVCKVLSFDGNSDGVVFALRYLSELKNIEGMRNKEGPLIDVVSMSVGMLKDVTEITKEIEKLTEKGTICVAAAGNHGQRKDKCHFPAKLPNVFAVGAYDKDGIPVPSTTVAPDVYFAPGHHIASPSNLDNYSLQALTGSSVAAPAVAGLIALIIDQTYACFPNSKELRERIHDFLCIQKALRKCVNDNNRLEPEKLFRNMDQTNFKEEIVQILTDPYLYYRIPTPSPTDSPIPTPSPTESPPLSRSSSPDIELGPALL